MNIPVLPNLSTVDERALTWVPFRDGVEASWLYESGETGPAAAFLRYRPGARVPLHRHRGYEHIYVIRGSQTDPHGRLGPGSFIVNPPGTQHEVVSEDGCLVLIIWEQRVEIVGD